VFMIEQSEDLKNILDICPFGIITVNESKIITNVNAYGAKLLGYSEKEMLECALDKYIIDKTNIKRDLCIIEFSKLKAAEGSGNIAQTVVGLTKSGKSLALSVTIGEIGTCSVLIFHNPLDFTPADSLTGMIQRDQLYANLNALKGNYSLLFIDLDGFKKVNDTLGHSIGDEVLKIVADRIGNSIRKTDLVCRYGGDEFIVVLPTPSKTAADVVSEKIKHSIAKVINASMHNINITCSIGVSNSTESANIAEVIKLADTRMYSGKGIVIKNRKTVL